MVLVEDIIVAILALGPVPALRKVKQGAGRGVFCSNMNRCSERQVQIHVRFDKG